MINVNYWMGRVRHLAENGGDAISELSKMWATKTIPYVNEVYYADEPVRVYEERDHYSSPEAVAKAFNRIEPEVDVVHIRGVENIDTMRPLTEKPIVYFGTPSEQKPTEAGMKRDKEKFEKADAIDVFAPCWRQWLIDDYKLPPDKIFTIPQSVDMDVFKKVDAQRLRDKYDCDILLGYIGSTQETYMRVDLNRLMKKLLKHNPSTALVILTYDLQNNRFMLFDKNVLPRVVAHGVPHDRMPQFISAFDITLCLGSAPFAGNMKEIEAQACESPTVAFDLPNRRHRFGKKYPYLAKMRKFKGLRMEGKSYVETDLVRKITTLMDDENERKRIGKRNRKQAEKFSRKNVGKMIMNMYKEIL